MYRVSKKSWNSLLFWKESIFWKNVKRTPDGRNIWSSAANFTAKNHRSKACAFCNLEGYLEPFIGSLEYSRNCKINPTSLQVYSGSQTNLGNSKTLNHGPLQCSLESSYGSLHKYLRKCWSHYLCWIERSLESHYWSLH